MSDWEAYRIATTETESARQATILSRGESLKPPTDGGSPESLHQVASLTVLDRVARRWLDARACLKCENGCIDILELCRSDVEMRARQVYDAERRRRMAVLQSLERLARGLGSRAGRKSVMVFSESFLRDQTIESALRGVLEAAQQALVSIYFVSTQGLTGVRWASADQRAPLRPGDIGGMSAEDNQLEFAAAAHLADETGGRLLAA